MTLDPAFLEQRTDGRGRGSFGRVAQWVWISGCARMTRNYPSRVQEGMWVWVKYSKLKAKKDLSIPTRPPTT